MNDKEQNYQGRAQQDIEHTLDEHAMGQLLGQPQGVPVSNGTMNSGRKIPDGLKVPLTHQALPTIASLPDGSQSLPLGSGVINGLLGEGGMARVYRIWNEKFELYRAVKILLPTGRPELMERFETEIKISAKLHHPNIVETYAVGEWNGLPYIEMELVEGVSLDHCIRNHGKLPMEVCVAIAIQIARALGYAHTQEFLLYGKTYQGIIHRDLKPANIMISKSGVVKLMDFGIARPTEVGLHTMDGNLVGTLPYLSPEQMDEKEIDQRSDLYAFGAILYESLIGEKTFPQSTVTNLMKMKISNSYRTFESFSISIHPALEKLVEKCLSIDKNDRFTTATEVETSLAGIYRTIADEPSELVIRRYITDPSGFAARPYKKRRFKKINYLPWIIGGSIAFAVLLVVGILLLLPPVQIPQKMAPNVAVAPVKAPEPVVQTLPSVSDTPFVDESSAAPEAPPAPKSATMQPRKPVEEPPTRPAETRRVKPPPAIVQEAGPSTDGLAKKYGSNDPVAIGDAACTAGQFGDAILALKDLSAQHPQKIRGTMLCAYSYLETNKVAKASQLVASLPSDDAFVILIRGRIALAQGNIKGALDYFEQALTKPSSVRAPGIIRGDALYYSGVANDSRYKSDPTPEARQAAMMAWNSLKRFYGSQPDHFRFKTANEKLASF